ncbi:hypothetical protein EW026_g6888 [Hermanssonia centrifuga]|uniref:Zn-dependent exopeptidase n=1 Tax=Hermanssonia centrifuga TaxID=98765 RepID=A0A4S4K9K1_9APHY|nr:hypothetical protein EW026_g6888 [Hermanssonia centrifuga]
MSSEKVADKVDRLEQQSPPCKHASRRSRLWILVVVLLIYQLLKLVTRSCLDILDYASLSSGPQKWALDVVFGSGQALSSVELENLYLSVPDTDSALAASRAYATHPHLASSKEDYEDAKVMLKLFQDQFNVSTPKELPVYSAGTSASRNATLHINKLNSPVAWIDVYYPVMNTPLDRSVQILDSDGTTLWDADLVEDGDPADPEAAKYKDYVPTWHGLSKEGDVQGQLIYANYGRQEDYQELLALGTNFTGKIVITRYGGIFRGLKIKGAQELGAAGVLVYSDPRDDGSVTVENGYEAYPAGPARNPTSVQRGSVQFISQYPGDPTTPGYPAYENATRTEGENIPKIPSLPISWANAERLLAEISLNGDARKLTGQTSERIIKLVNHVDNKVMPIWNTMAAIPGHIKNETLLIGCHRDAWVMGAADPTSGTVSLHEVIRGFGTLLAHGWKPLRNVVIASWDAEEYGLVGSTEWAEDFADWVSDNVVAYINVGSPSLAHLIRKTAQDVPHPLDSTKTLWDARTDIGPFTHGSVDDESIKLHPANQLRRSPDTGIATLGSGSDFTVFLQRLGIASMDQSFSMTPSDAVYHYHSIYDSQRWQEIYADPTFSRHVAVAKHLGLTALRLTDSIILPLNTTQYSLELDDYLAEIEELASSLSFSVDFSALSHSIKTLQGASQELDDEKAEAEEKFKEALSNLPQAYTPSSVLFRALKWVLGLGKRTDPIETFIKAAKRVQKANTKLVAFEKGFISEGGIKDREWYRHLGVAPGKWLGYGATTLPSIYDALVFEKNTTLAEAEVERVSALLGDLTNVLVS